MPLESNAGYSEDTAVKQRDFEYVLGVLLNVARSERCMGRPWAHSEFLYFDLNAGPGIVGGVEGSPLIFTRKALAIGLPFRAFFFERDHDNAERLAAALQRICEGDGGGPRAVRGKHELRVIQGDHNLTVTWAIQEYLAALPRKWVYGLAYGDGNGKTDAPFGPMATLADRFAHVDLLLNVHATVYKRVRGGDRSAGYLLDGLDGIKKQYRLIREPVGRPQWTMLFQTNWASSPDFEQIKFRRFDSEDGRRLVERVNLIKGEVIGRAPPFAAGPPTAPTPSTFGTRASSPSEQTSSPVAAASASGAAAPAPPSRTT